MSEDKLVPSAVKVQLSREVDGIEMGVLSDGRSYLSGRALGRLCGSTDGSMIARHSASWNSGARESKLARFLMARGFDRPSLFIPLGKENAYTDDVCMHFLEYYSFEAQDRNGHALENYKKFARAGLRLFIYGALGYDPASAVEDGWQKFHDRLMMNRFPIGHFSVFSELAQFVLTAIRGGLVVDEHTVPDISVGIAWAKHWRESGLQAKYGGPVKFPHRYPPYFPQAQANDVIEANIFPDAALGDFRAWLHTTYIPEKFPKYLQSKSKKKELAPGAVAPILAAFELPSEPALTPKRR